MKLHELVAVAKAEILADIESGLVPESVANFSQLHDFVDANMYGLWLTDIEGVESPFGEDEMALMVEVQAALDSWIKGGRN